MNRRDVEALVRWLGTLTERATAYQKASRRDFTVVIVFPCAVSRDRVEKSLDALHFPNIETIFATERTALLGHRIRALAWWGKRLEPLPGSWAQMLRARCDVKAPEIVIGGSS